MITALGSEALSRAEIITKQADIIAALTLDVLQGTPRAFDYGTSNFGSSSACYVYSLLPTDIHANRPHYGQQIVAGRMRALLDSDIHPSKIRGETME